MSRHEIWHVLLLASTLFAAAGIALLTLFWFAFDEPPAPGTMVRPLVWGVVAVVAILLVVEWVGVH